MKARQPSGLPISLAARCARAPCTSKHSSSPSRHPPGGQLHPRLLLQARLLLHLRRDRHLAARARRGRGVRRRLRAAAPDGDRARPGPCWRSAAAAVACWAGYFVVAEHAAESLPMVIAGCQRAGVRPAEAAKLVLVVPRPVRALPRRRHRAREHLRDPDRAHRPPLLRRPARRRVRLRIVIPAITC